MAIQLLDVISFIDINITYVFVNTRKIVEGFKDWFHLSNLINCIY